MEAVAKTPTLPPPTEAYISADEFLDMLNSPEYADCRSELVEGKVIEMSHPKPLHGYVASKLGVALANHVEQLGVGTLFVSEVGYVLARRPSGRDTVRGIDISFLSKQQTTNVLSDRWFEGAPDLAVEVMSPSNAVSEINLKVSQLLDAGASAVWIVDPATRSVHVHPAQGIQAFCEDDVLIGGEVLPDFSIEVADIFPA